LLRTIFDAHPGLAMAHEPQFMGSVVRRSKRLSANGVDLGEFLDLIYGNSNFRRLELGRAEVELALSEAAPANPADAVRVVFGVYAARENKSLYGDKTPGYIIQLPELARWFPEARFVHVIRDGRNVALSYLERPWGPSTIGEAALYWRSRVGRGRAAGKALGPDRYVEVRYEDVVTDPESEVKRLCEFLALPWRPEMLRYQEAAEEFIAQSHQPEAFKALVLPPTSGLRKWSTEMDNDDVDLFEAIAGGLLEDLGYERRSTTPRLPVRLRARWAEAQWAGRRARAALRSRIRR
jgi:hypothetical protein